MQEHGRVVECDDGTVKIVIEETDACKKCPACGMCRPAGGKRYIQAQNRVGARVGDSVTFEISAPYSLFAVMLFFGLPVFLGLVGLVVSTGSGEIVTIVIGSAGFATGLLIAKVINDVLAARRALLPRVIEILNRDKT